MTALRSETIRQVAKMMAASEHLPHCHHLQVGEATGLRDLADSSEITHARAWDIADRLDLKDNRPSIEAIEKAMGHLDEAMNYLRSAARELD